MSSPAARSLMMGNKSSTPLPWFNPDNTPLNEYWRGYRDGHRSVLNDYKKIALASEVERLKVTARELERELHRVIELKKGQ